PSRISSSGRTAQVPSSSSRKAYSWASRSRTAAGGCSVAALTVRTLLTSPSAPRRHSRQKTRSPSSHDALRPALPFVDTREDTCTCRRPELAGQSIEKEGKVLTCPVRERTPNANPQQ